MENSRKQYLRLSKRSVLFTDYVREINKKENQIWRCIEICEIHFMDSKRPNRLAILQQ